MAERNPNISTCFHVHLVSDSTGETLVGMMKASTAQFRNATALEHLHTLVRSEAQLTRTLDAIESKPGVVLYTLVDPAKRKTLETFCAERHIPTVSILDPTLSMLGRYLGVSVTSEVGAQRTLDDAYYRRIGALDFAMAHDDGQQMDGLIDADLILLGVSRTSKTPTSIYLANRGYKTGNIPLVPTGPDGIVLPPIIDRLPKDTGPLVVGLFASPDRIVEIRQNRLKGLSATGRSGYTDEELVRDELRSAKRLFSRRGFPVIDVSRRSIEETAAQIINLYKMHRPDAAMRRKM
ncbi:pyruvate, water dikinase regulatory protein [Algimonas porphyrae]|uniref:Putative pyruvate, phosphate dikinase regulatory protein n=1 Tax=Algimonas porphyrae TaxID=1128113 RepID=A0ABQ5UZC7_9PROT|nr:pyruvate, water dikinase regulatory protein [Algimonas porphyrae]GLQ20551.1 putative pyruvate, phosphate dikinase regulatory protein [Algimonas porphyrae]